MGLVISSTRADFQSPNGLTAQTVIVSGGLPPYSAASSDTDVCSVAQATSPNVYGNSDTLSDSTLTGLTKASGGPNGATDAEYTGTGSPIGSNAVLDRICSVVMGQTYTPSFFIDPSQVTNNTGSQAQIQVASPSGQVLSSYALASSDTAPKRYAAPSFTLPMSFSPTSLAGCVGWFDAADATSITQSSGKVSQWNDKSGSGNTVTQGTSANQPAYSNTAPVSGAAAGEIAFAGSQWLIKASSNLPLGSSAWTWIYVGKVSSSGELFGWGSNADGGKRFGAWMGSTLGMEVEGYGEFGTHAADSNFHVVSGIYTGGPITNFRQYYDGTAETMSNSGGAITPSVTSSEWDIGKIPGASAGYITGTLCELIIFNRAITVTERAQVEAYLIGKWMISASNPQVHVYAELLSSAIVASGQKFKISQPMLAPSTYDPQTYIAQTAAFTVTPKYSGSAHITYSDSTP